MMVEIGHPTRIHENGCNIMLRTEYVCVSLLCEKKQKEELFQKEAPFEFVVCDGGIDATADTSNFWRCRSS